MAGSISWVGTAVLVRQRDFGGTSGFRGLTPGRIVAVATNARQNGRPGASWTRRRKQELRISIPELEVESAPIASVGNPTALHGRILMSITCRSMSSTNNSNSTEQRMLYY